MEARVQTSAPIILSTALDVIKNGFEIKCLARKAVHRTLRNKNKVNHEKQDRRHSNVFF